MLEKIKSTKSYIGKSEMTSGNEYRVTLTYNGKTIWFNFHDNVYNKSNKNDFVYALLSDAQAYEYARDINDFKDEFCYSDYNTAKRVYNGCKKQYERLNKLFSDDEICEIDNELMALGF